MDGKIFKLFENKHAYFNFKCNLHNMLIEFRKQTIIIYYRRTVHTRSFSIHHCIALENIN